MPPPYPLLPILRTPSPIRQARGSHGAIGGLAGECARGPGAWAFGSALLWQADLQIRSPTVSEDKGNLTARVVVAAEFGEALAARVEMLLPVGVGIVTLGPGVCRGSRRRGDRELRARVECTLGDMPARSNREPFVVTTTPPNGIARDPWQR